MKVLSLGILLFSVVNTTGVFAQKPPYGIALDKTKTEFLDKTEISITDWRNYYWDMKYQYGDTSLEAKQALPDMALFRQVYGFPFYTSLPFRDSIQSQMNCLPMTCVSYEQILNYCQWRTEKVNELWKIQKKSSMVTYSLPSKEDFEKGLSNAIISQYQFLSAITVKKTKCTGITDNVPEYTNDKNMIVVGGDVTKIETAPTVSTPVGFRCKAIIVKK
ncbi:MAG: formylglycine-generating enzyme family protein [Bacteroidales bacterium]|jgi:formylglycine-generating enzyme required for sulfatase activity|nr:formylglycine-generating enzyme family protein [Bacteroidales bacterium]